VRWFSADEGVQPSPGETPHGGFQCRFGLTVHWRHPAVIGRRGTPSSGGCLYVRASGPALTVAISGVQWGAMRGSEAWVFILCGDLIVGVIGLTTLGLAYLHIGPAILGLAYLHIACHSLAWFLSPNTHWLIVDSYFNTTQSINTTAILYVLTTVHSLRWT
jgi:hypothetical protein